jgi:acetolactate synthase-1/2/3 large subunit
MIAPKRGTLALVSGLGDDTGGGIYAFDGRAVEPIDRISTTGLAVRDGRLARLLWSSGEAGSVGEILIYDAHGVQRYWRVDELREGHDLTWEGDSLLAVSTMANSVLWLGPSGNVERTWKAPGEGDAWHLNSLLVHEGHVYAAAFGRFDAHREWSGNADERGLVVDLSRDRDVISGLSQPHHPRLAGGTWLICNSGRGELLALDESSHEVRGRAELGGWTRGLAITDDEVFVGVSGDRKRRDPDDLAWIAVLRRKDLRLRRRIPLPCREVYDIVLAPPELVEGVRRGFRTNPLRVAEQDQHGLFAEAGVEPVRLWATGDPLEADECRVRIEAAVPDVLGASAIAEIAVTIENLGPAFLVSAPPNPVNLAYKWYPDSGGSFLEGPRTRLPQTIPPRGSTTAKLALEAPSAPGGYRLLVTLVQEHVRWFDEVSAENASTHDVKIIAPPRTA